MYGVDSKGRRSHVGALRGPGMVLLANTDAPNVSDWRVSEILRELAHAA